MKRVCMQEETSSILFNTDEWTAQIRANKASYSAGKRISIGIIAAPRNTLIDSNGAAAGGHLEEGRVDSFLVSNGNPRGSTYSTLLAL